MTFGSCVIHRFLARKGKQSDLHIKKENCCVENELKGGIMEQERKPGDQLRGCFNSEVMVGWGRWGVGRMCSKEN